MKPANCFSIPLRTQCATIFATKFSYLDLIFSLISNSSTDLEETVCIVDCYCGNIANPYREDLCQSGLFSFFDPRNSRKNELGFGERNQLRICRIPFASIAWKFVASTVSTFDYLWIINHKQEEVIQNRLHQLLHSLLRSRSLSRHAKLLPTKWGGALRCVALRCVTSCNEGTQKYCRDDETTVKICWEAKYKQSTIVMIVLWIFYLLTVRLSVLFNELCYVV